MTQRDDPMGDPMNGLEAPPHPKPMRQPQRWVCNSPRKGGGVCREVLMTITLTPGSQVIVRCPRCHAWHTREVQ